MSLHIYYDGDCPFCSHYVRLLRLRRAVGDTELINVREAPEARKFLAEHGLNLDQGMAVQLDGRWHDGADAVHILATLSTPSSIFNRINRRLFSSPRLTRLAYPLMRIGRNIVLLLLGRERLGTDSFETRAPWILFNAVFGLFAVLHCLIYVFRFKPPGYPSTWLIGLLGAALLLRPQSGRLAMVLLLCFGIDAWLQMPMFSNHTIIKNFLLLGVLVCALRQAWKGGTWTAFYTDVAPLGRALLLTMYVFGVFHKINTDFLNPSVSCAVALWRVMPAPLSWIDTAAMHYLAIYGTLVIETAILLCLLLRRTRTVGIGLGIAFHGLLALSGYAMYVAFSTLTVVLHLLFIEPGSAARILASSPWKAMQRHLHSPYGLSALAAWIGLMALLAWNVSYSQMAILWLPVILGLAWIILRYGDHETEPAPATRLLRSDSLSVNLLSVLFMLNCFAPYLGLKTAQSINMFANLHLEGGRSNHLIFSNPPGPFGYLGDVVTITESAGSAYLNYVRQYDLQMTYYALLDHLERNPGVVVGFERAGQPKRGQSAATLDGEISAVLHPRWMRNWFHFNPVDPASPKPCAPDRQVAQAE